jgi:hypothetical protein
MKKIEVGETFENSQMVTKKDEDRQKKHPVDCRIKK